MNYISFQDNRLFSDNRHIDNYTQLL